MSLPVHCDPELEKLTLAHLDCRLHGGLSCCILQASGGETAPCPGQLDWSAPERPSLQALVLRHQQSSVCKQSQVGRQGLSSAVEAPSSMPACKLWWNSQMRMLGAQQKARLGVRLVV